MGNLRDSVGDWSLVTRFVVCFTVALWATPIPDRWCRPGWLPTPTTRRPSGKIAPIIDRTFSLEVTQGQARKTLEFLIDGDTGVEGKLQIGSQAAVEYRSVDGKNVVVARAAGWKAR